MPRRKPLKYMSEALSNNNKITTKLSPDAQILHSVFQLTAGPAGQVMWAAALRWVPKTLRIGEALTELAQAGLVAKGDQANYTKPYDGIKTLRKEDQLTANKYTR